MEMNDSEPCNETPMEVSAEGPKEDGQEENPEDNPDLEDGEIEDDDDDEIPPPPTEQNDPKKAPEPTAVPTDKKEKSEERDRKRRRDSGDRKEKGERHLTEAEKSVRYLHKLERAERERRERLRKEQFGPADDWAVNVEKAIANVLKKSDNASGADEGEEEKEKRGKKRKKRRGKKNKKPEDKQDEIDEDEMLQVRGGSPENKPPKEKSPSSGEGYESYDSEYDSDSSLYQSRRRRIDRGDRDRDRDRRRNRDGSRRDRKKDKKDKRQSEQNRANLVDANGICLFYMQGKCHRHIETAPKEILGDFPRLSREGAQNLVNQTQKMLEIKYGINNGATQETTTATSNIPSLFDITIPVPPELMGQNQNQSIKNSTNTEEPKPKSDKPEKERKRTRWNDEPPVPIAQLSAFMNPAFSNPAFNGLNMQDQQKLREYQMNFQMKGFYSESDQDMRKQPLVTSNGDVDMRSLPLQTKTETPKQDLPAPIISSQMDMDHRPPISNLVSQTLNLAGLTNQPKTETVIQQQNIPENIDDLKTDTSLNLNIDEKSADSGCDLPSNLPKKQRELFLRIQAQQKENTLENQKDDDDDAPFKDDDWYSSDDDNDQGNKMVIHLEEEEKPKEDVTSPPHILSPPTIKPEVFDKLGDLSKIDISAEVTKLLTSIKSNNQSQKQQQSVTQSTQQSSEIKNPRDPRSAMAAAASTETSQTSLVSNSDPRSKAKIAMDRRESGSSIYEQGFYNADQQSNKLSIYEQGTVGRSKDVDLRSLDGASKDLDMRSLGPYGDTDLRAGGRQDVDLRQLNLPFKAIQNYTPATEIDASIGSHSPIPYRVHIIDIPRPDYSGLKLNAQDSQVNSDPRLRKIFRVPSTDEKESPASPTHPPHASPPKTTRVDPRRRPEIQKPDPNPKDHSNMSYAQQLQLLQNSAFYQSLTSNQKLMLNQEIASKADQSVSNDPILLGILSNVGLINSAGQNNVSAMNILANVNSMVNPMNQMMSGNQMGPMGQGMMGNMGPNMPMAGNVGPGLLGAAPGIPNMGMPNMPPSNMQNDYMGYDPRNGPMMGGNGPYNNFPNDPNNFGQFNDDFYNDGSDQNFGNNFNNRNNNRNFRNERNNQGNNRRGRNWNNNGNNRNNRNMNNNNRNNRSNRSYTPP